jgi:hypothetical protein
MDNEDFNFDDLKKKPDVKKEDMKNGKPPLSMNDFTDQFVKDPKRLAKFLDLLDSLPKEHKNTLIEKLGQRAPFNNNYAEMPDMTPREKLNKKVKKLENIRKQSVDAKQSKKSNDLVEKIFDMLKNNNINQNNDKETKQITETLTGSSKTSLRIKKKRDKYKQKLKQKKNKIN